MPGRRPARRPPRPRGPSAWAPTRERVQRAAHRMPLHAERQPSPRLSLTRHCDTLRVTGFVRDYGLIIVFLLIALETSGLPLPGETALVAAGVLASQGHFSIRWVIVVATAAAILGDNIGYWIGRKLGRGVQD